MQSSRSSHFANQCPPMVVRGNSLHGVKSGESSCQSLSALTSTSVQKGGKGRGKGVALAAQAWRLAAWGGPMSPYGRAFGALTRFVIRAAATVHCVGRPSGCFGVSVWRLAMPLGVFWCEGPCCGCPGVASWWWWVGGWGWLSVRVAGTRGEVKHFNAGEIALFGALR